MEDLAVHSKWMIAVFITGYFFITIEHIIKVDKATIALLMGIVCWIIQYTQGGSTNCKDSLTCLGEHISDISQIVFFLMGALIIVEMINAHRGFAIISEYLQVSSKRKLLWIVSFISFFLSAILDNLTTTIVMITLLSRLMERSPDRLLLGGAVVIAANAGGAWTPVGDVTTTMLWIGGQVSTLATMRDLVLPSFVSLIVPLLILSSMVKGELSKKTFSQRAEMIEPMGNLIFFLGIGALAFVPIFRMLTGLPPFMGILFGLSLIWLVTDIVHRRHQRDHLRVPSILTKIDFSSLLFFLGILLAIDAIDSAGVLVKLADWFDKNLAHTALIATTIGLASAVVDNVPLVAATMGMYTLDQHPVDSQLWQLIAFCAGTGGSILIMGSAAGVVYMGLEKVDFFWYLKRISFAALAGYFAGLGAYILAS